MQVTVGDAPDAYVVSWTTFRAGDHNDLHFGASAQQLSQAVRAHESMYYETLCGAVR